MKDKKKSPHQTTASVKHKEAKGTHSSLRKVHRALKHKLVQHQRDKEIIEEILERQANILRQIKDAIVVSDSEGHITYWNNAAEHLYGFKSEEALGKKIDQVYHYKWVKPEDERAARQALKTKGVWRGRNIHRKKGGEELLVESTVNVLKDGKNSSVGLLTVIRDIGGQKQMEDSLQKEIGALEEKLKQKSQEFQENNKLLQLEIQSRQEAAKLINGRDAIVHLLAEATTLKAFLDSVVKLMREWSGCECVGIRVLQDSGEIPYESYVGFSQEFWRAENALSIKSDRCSCIRTMTQEKQGFEEKLTTPFGSYVCNNSVKFISELSEQDRAQFRGRCIEEGYISVALIPIRFKNKVIGVIHLADKKEGKVPIGLVHFFESCSLLLGQSMDKFSMQDTLKLNFLIQSAISSLLQLSLQEIHTEQLLQEALQIFLSIKDFGIEQMGSIFLAEEGQDGLVLKAHKGFPKSLLKTCEHMAFGKCICGKAASSRKIQFIEHDQETYGICCQDMHPHGHYCVPILFGNSVLGVINVYAKVSSQKDPRIEEFFLAAANGLAGILESKRAGQSLNDLNKKLEKEINDRIRIENELQRLNQELEHRVIERTIQLQFERDRVQQYLEVAGVIMVVIDMNQTVALINKRGCEILGFHEEEIIGKNWFDHFIPASDRNKTKDAFKKLMAGKINIVEYFENRVMTASKEEKLIAWHNKILTNQDGSIYASLSSGEDITERKRAEEDLKRAYIELESRVAQRTQELAKANEEFLMDIEKRKIVEETLKRNEASLAAAQRIAHLGNWDWDVVNNELSWSDEIYRIFGLSPHAFGATYETFLEAVHPEDRDFVKSAVANALKGEAGYSVDHRVIRPDGSVRFVHEEADVIMDESGRVMRMIGIVHDVTERKKAGEELIEAQKELLTSKRLSDVGTLAATVAHELRNPLGVIRTAVYNIKRKTLNPLLEKNFANIEKKILEADQIINNLLFYSKIKPPHFEMAMLYDILKESIDGAKKKFNQQKTTLSEKIGALKKVAVECDPHQIGEVFNNILNNAFETLAYKKGKIEVRAVKTEVDTVKIIFEDNGPGIDEAHLTKIFDPFYTTKTNGTGLGLSVCQQIVKLHAGKIEVESLKDKATLFTVTLPVRRNIP